MMKSKMNDIVLKGIIFTIFVMTMLYAANAMQKANAALEELQRRTAILEEVMQNQKRGRRVDPFRCSDAKKHFSQVGVYVDCVKIECEVNGDC